MGKEEFFLLTAHGVTRFGDRLWMFGMPLILYELFPSSLLIVALYGLASNLGIVIIPPRYIKWMVRWDRLQLIRKTLFIELGMLIASSFAVMCFFGTSHSSSYITTLLHEKFLWKKCLFWIGSSVLLLSALLMEGFASVRFVAVQRDWIPQLGLRHSDPDARRTATTKLNSTFQRLDLLCDLLGPPAMGLLMSAISLRLVYIILAIVNALSFTIDLLFMSWAYRLCEDVLRRDPQPLQQPPPEEDDAVQKARDDVGLCSSSAPSSSMERGGPMDVSDKANGLQCMQRALLSPSHTTPHDDDDDADGTPSCISPTSSAPCRCFSVLLDQALFIYKSGYALPVVAMALLYFNVLGSSGLYLAFLRSKKFGQPEVGGVRAAGALSGVLGTLIFSSIAKILTVTLTACLFQIFQTICLLFAVGFLLLGEGGGVREGGEKHSRAFGETLDGAAFVIFCVLSRLGLYAFDIGQMQILQDSGETTRLNIGAIEKSWIGVVSILLSISGAVFSKPEQFVWLSCISVGCCTTATLCMSLYTWRVEKKVKREIASTQWSPG